MKRNDQHYKKYRELEAELKKGKITTKDFNSIDNLSYKSIQTELIQSQDQISAAEATNNLDVEKHKEVLEDFQGTVVHGYRLEKAKLEYNRIKEDIDRCKLIVATLKQQVRKPPHHIIEVSLAYLQRDLKKNQYHTNLLERRRTRRYRIYRKERPPIEVESDSEYCDGGYSTAEDLKDKEYLPHRYKLTRSANRVPHPNQPRPQLDSEEIQHYLELAYTVIHSITFFYCNGQIHPRMDIPACTSAYFWLNISILTLQVIGSYKTQFIPPVIIMQSWKTMLFTADHFWTLYKVMHSSYLGILQGLDEFRNILLW